MSVYKLSIASIKKLYKEAYKEGSKLTLGYGEEKEKSDEEIIDKNVKEWIRINLEGR